MKFEAIMFDLDGTLLSMDINNFTKCYFGLLSQKVCPHGYEPEGFVASIWEGTKAMVMNDGTITNEERFWQVFAQIHGERVLEDKYLFDEFYKCEFAGAVVSSNPEATDAVRAVSLARNAADKVILATNSIFPLDAVKERLSWVGLSLSDFDYVTSYENSSFCKPNPKYYEEILSKNGLSAKNCLMIGNDVKEDIVPTSALGIDNFLVTDCIIGEVNDGVKNSGSFEEMLTYLENL